MKYEDLSIRILGGSGNTYPVHVTAPRDLGSKSGTLELPFEIEGIAGALGRLRRGLARDASVASAVGGLDVTVSDDEPAWHPDELGEQLFNALFQNEDLRRLYDRSVELLDGTNDLGVRIRLQIDLEGDGLPELAALPWEFMRPPGGEPLAIGKRTPIVRYLDLMQSSAFPPFERPLRILVAMANPTTVKLDLEGERARIEQQWAGSDEVDIDFLENTTKVGLMEKLAEGGKDYHVLHFMGHGDFSREEGGVLLFHGEDGGAERVDSTTMKRIVADEKTLRLVILNACETAESPSGQGDGPGSELDKLDPFAGVATALLSAGLPAVVAMQFLISDNAAKTFSDVFYKRIVQGLPVDAAVSEARRRIIVEDSGSSEWATPVLFLRSPDGELFPPPVPTEAFTVFVGRAASDVSGDRDRLVPDLKRQGVKVVEVSPVEDPEEHRELVRKAVEGADLCVHLLGRSPGEALPGQPPDVTVPVEQTKIALDYAHSVLVLIPEGFQVDDIEEPAYADFHEHLTERQRDAREFELATWMGLRRLTDTVLTKRDDLKTARPSESLRTAMIELHQKDIAEVGPLMTYFMTKNIPLLTKPDRSATGGLGDWEALEEDLKKSGVFMVVYGEVGREWVLEKLSHAMTTKVLKSLPTQICVYVGPPDKPSDALDFGDFHVIPNMHGFDPQELDRILSEAEAGA